MQTFIAGRDVDPTILFGEGRQPSIPDVGSATYTVLDHVGAPISGLIDVPITTTTTSFSFTPTIPGINNSLTTPRLFERRRVLVTFLAQGRRAYQEYSYRLTDRLNHSVTLNQVREFLGVRPDELGDDAVDLLEIYMWLDKLLGGTLLADALASGTTNEMAANDAIRMKAALICLPSLRHRMAQKETNGVNAYERPSILNTLALEASANERLNDALGQINGLNSETYRLILISTNNDLFSG